LTAVASAGFASDGTRSASNASSTLPIRRRLRSSSSAFRSMMRQIQASGELLRHFSR
jgi:hypothetical protein